MIEKVDGHRSNEAYSRDEIGLSGSSRNELADLSTQCFDCAFKLLVLMIERSRLSPYQRLCLNSIDPGALAVAIGLAIHRMQYEASSFFLVVGLGDQRMCPEIVGNARWRSISVH